MAVEAKAGIVSSDHAVFLGRNIDADDLADATRLTLFDQRIKHGEFHLALQHAAAHQPKIELQTVSSKICPIRTDTSPLSPNLSRQPPVKRDKARVLSDGHNFSAGISSGREIELIRLVDQLCDSL